MSRRILKADMFDTGAGTHKFRCEWEGEWDGTDLITAIDNKKWDNPTPEDLNIRHYGGRIEHLRQLPNGNYTATVCVYYD